MAHAILIVDDDSTTRASLADMISNIGHSVVDQVKDGYQALEAIRLRKPSIVLLDVVMPGMDGLAVLARIRRMRPDTKVVMMTGLASDIATVRQCLKMGATDFFVKPITEERLRDCILKIPELWMTKVRELGKLCCVGYTPTFDERRVMAQGRMGYLLYPTCHLAMQFFRDKLRPDVNMVILVIQKGLAMYGSRQAGPEPYDAMAYKEKPPWQRVVVEAQKSYHHFWLPALRDRLLPRVIPCMVAERSDQPPAFISPEEILTMIDEPLPSIGEPPEGAPVDAQLIGDPGKAAEWSKLAAKMCIALNKVEARHPQLVSNVKPPPAEKKDPESKAKIDTRPVKIVPDHLRSDEQSRMNLRKD